MRLQANNRDRRTIRRSSTRLDAHAIRSLQSLQSLQSFKHTSTIAKRKTTTWTTEQTKHDDDENDFNINSTIRSEEDIPSHHRTTKLSNMSKRSSFVRGSVVRSSIVRSMSMIIPSIQLLKVAPQRPACAFHTTYSFLSWRFGACS
jgi:hypothetical protein